MKETPIRELAIEAAVKRIVTSINGKISDCEINRRASMTIGASRYSVEFDGKSICIVDLISPYEFKMTII